MEKKIHEHSTGSSSEPTPTSSLLQHLQSAHWSKLQYKAGLSSISHNWDFKTQSEYALPNDNRETLIW